MGTREDRLEEIETGFWERGPLEGRDIEWLIAEVKHLRSQHENLQRTADGAVNKIAEVKAARIADLNELAEGFELTGRASVNGAVFRACARTVQDKITEIELGAIDV